MNVLPAFAAVALLLIGGDQPLRVGGDVTAPVLIKKVEPKYHQGKRRMAGVILLELVITKKGVVRDVKVIKGADDPMAANVVEAVRQWKFKPATKKGRPVAVIYNITSTVHVR